MYRLLPIIGKVSGGYWWLTNWTSVVRSWVSCLVRVGDPDWTCGAPTPHRGGTLQHRRGLNPQPRVQQSSIHCTLAPEGFEPLTKGSWATRLTNCTLWHPLEQISFNWWRGCRVQIFWMLNRNSKWVSIFKSYAMHLPCGLATFWVWCISVAAIQRNTQW